jgi:DNA invertase Pin-like site-specific DNA recombinase
VAENVNTSISSGLFTLSILVVVAEFERLLICERTLSTSYAAPTSESARFPMAST